MRDNLDKIICWLMIFAAALLLVVIAFPRPADGKTAPPEEAEAAEPAEAIEVVAEEIPPQKPEYDIPLDMELQQYIITLAERYDLAPELVFAVIGTESNYNPNRTGDNGNSIGLMQIQPRWHQERMDRLDVDNLYNPFENVLVGIDLLAEEIRKGGVTWGLTAYNAGEDHANFMEQTGQVSEYAETVLKLAEELK